MNNLFLLPEVEAPEYTPIGEPHRVVDVLYPDASPDEKNQLERNLTINIAIAQDNVIADLMLDGQQFVSEEDYLEEKFFAFKAIAIVNRLGNHYFFDVAITNQVLAATKKFYENMGARNGI